MKNVLLSWFYKISLIISIYCIFQCVAQASDESLLDSITCHTGTTDKINLALRRTAHLLLKSQGDSTSTIPPIIQESKGVWLIKLAHTLSYDKLPSILQSSFDVHGITCKYDVAIIRCRDGQIQLGYSFSDYSVSKDVPCGGRELEKDCYNIKVSFVQQSAVETESRLPIWVWATCSFLLIGLFVYKKRKPNVLQDSNININTPDIEQEDSKSILQSFGDSTLDMKNLRLVCHHEVHQLTYREAKLLNLFVNQQDIILDRSHIIEKVWADEGILVSRSVDMFVSRLRKLLLSDPKVQITTIHGVGYKMVVSQM